MRAYCPGLSHPPGRAAAAAQAPLAPEGAAAGRRGASPAAALRALPAPQVPAGRPCPAPMPPGFPPAAPQAALTIFGQALDHLHGRLEPGGVHGAGLRHVPGPAPHLPPPPARPPGRVWRGELASPSLVAAPAADCTGEGLRGAGLHAATPGGSGAGCPAPAAPRPAPAQIPQSSAPSRAGHGLPSLSGQPHPAGRARPATPPAQPPTHPYLRPGLRRPCYVSHSSARPLPSPRPAAARGTPGNAVRPPRPLAAPRHGRGPRRCSRRPPPLSAFSSTRRHRRPLPLQQPLAAKGEGCAEAAGWPRQLGRGRDRDRGGAPGPARGPACPQGPARAARGDGGCSPGAQGAVEALIPGSASGAEETILSFIFFRFFSLFLLCFLPLPTLSLPCLYSYNYMIMNISKHAIFHPFYGPRLSSGDPPPPWQSASLLPPLLTAILLPTPSST